MLAPSVSIARKNGDKRYFTGRPCSKGHTAERYASSGNCVECNPRLVERCREHRRDVHNKSRKDRYWSNPEYRERQLELARLSKHKRYVRYQEDDEYREKHQTWSREARRKYQLQHRYGLTVEEYEAVLKAQNHACAICEQPFTKTPHVDHCHATGRRRELLCALCNSGLGKFLDKPDLLRSAISYLERHCGAQ